MRLATSDRNWDERASGGVGGGRGQERKSESKIIHTNTLFLCFYMTEKPKEDACV